MMYVCRKRETQLLFTVQQSYRLILKGRMVITLNR